MSEGQAPSILLRKCERSGIRLTRSYFQSWHASRSTPITNVDTAYEELVTDFLNKAIEDTSEPVIPDDFGRLPVETFPPNHLRAGGGVVLQINDTFDASHSAFSFLNLLKNTAPIRQVYRERAAGDQVVFPRGTLRWTLTDGYHSIQAAEYDHIPELNIQTPFGTKLLIQSNEVKNGMLMLRRNAIKVLGGDVSEMYGGDMIKELENRLKGKLQINIELNTPTPTLRNNIPTTSISNYNTGPRLSRSVPLRPPATPEQTSIPAAELMDIVEVFQHDFDEEEVNLPTHNSMEIDPPVDIPNSAVIEDSDDDFMPTTQPRISFSKRPAPSPAKEPSPKKKVALPSLAINTTALKNTTATASTTAVNATTATFSTTSSNQTTILNTPSSSTSTTSYETAAFYISSSKKRQVVLMEDGMRLKLEKDKVEKAEWFDPDESSDDEEEIVGVTKDNQGNVHLTFNKLKETLVDIKNGKHVNLPDQIFIRAKLRKIARLRWGDTSGFAILFNLKDSQNQEICCEEKKKKLCTECVQIIVYNETLMQLVDPGRKIKWASVMNGAKATKKKAIQEMQDKFCDKIYQIELDLSLIETWTEADDEAPSIPVVKKLSS